MASSELFSRGSLRDTLEATLARVDEEVDGAPEDHLLHADVEEWVKAIVALRGMRTPTLGEPWMDDAEEIRIDLSRTASGIFGRAPFPSSSGPSVAGAAALLSAGASPALASSRITATVFSVSQKDHVLRVVNAKHEIVDYRLSHRLSSAITRGIKVTLTRLGHVASDVRIVGNPSIKKVSFLGRVVRSDSKGTVLRLADGSLYTLSGKSTRATSASVAKAADISTTTTSGNVTVTVNGLQPGQTVLVTITQDGQQVDVNITLGAHRVAAGKHRRPHRITQPMRWWAVSNP